MSSLPNTRNTNRTCSVKYLKVVVVFLIERDRNWRNDNLIVVILSR
jgi:hypothetical protein